MQGVQNCKKERCCDATCVDRYATPPLREGTVYAGRTADDRDRTLTPGRRYRAPNRSAIRLLFNLAHYYLIIDPINLHA